MVFGGQTPKINDFRPAQKPCIKNPSVKWGRHAQRNCLGSAVGVVAVAVEAKRQPLKERVKHVADPVFKEEEPLFGG